MTFKAAATLLAAAALALALPGAGADGPGKAKARACTPCHGALGISVQPETPNLAGQPRAYLVAQLDAYRRGKRTHEQMTVMAKSLSDADIAELAEWFSSIAVQAKEPGSTP